MISASAPGKIILFGEHAVVYGQPALAVPVTQVQAVAVADVEADKRMKSDFLGDDWADSVRILAPDIGLDSPLGRLLAQGRTPHPLAAAIVGTLRAVGLASLPPLTARITSSIPVASGLGSGAAVSVALVRALADTLGKPLADEQVSAIAFEVEKLHHGTPSGIDNTVVTYARPVYFVKGQPIEIFRVGAPFTVVIGDTGIAASTKDSVGDVRQLWEADKPKMERLFAAIGSIVRTARQAIEGGHPEWLGPLMDENHALLREMSVSSPELERLTEAARRSGALGAKLSGGGRGGNMIALVRQDRVQSVTRALMEAGAKRTIVTEIS
ncbi:MAG: mevalonate kinase [Chloroflexota bacterium]